MSTTTTETISTPEGEPNDSPETSTNVDTGTPPTVTDVTDETPPETPVKALVDDVDDGQAQGHDQAAELATLAAERDELRLQVARLTVAAETGVPADLLRGGDEDELREHAEALVAYAGARATPDFGAGNRGESVRPENTDPLRTALGR